MQHVFILHRSPHNLTLSLSPPFRTLASVARSNHGSSVGAYSISAINHPLTCERSPGSSNFGSVADHLLHQHASSLFGVSTCGNFGLLRVAGNEVLIFARDAKARHLIQHIPGRPVRFQVGKLKVDQILSFDKNHIRGIVTQSRGSKPANPCIHCSIDPEGPFVVCANIPGHLDGRCGNCRFRGLTDCDAVPERLASEPLHAAQPLLLLAGDGTSTNPLCLGQDGNAEDPIEID